MSDSVYYSRCKCRGGTKCSSHMVSEGQSTCITCKKTWSLPSNNTYTNVRSHDHTDLDSTELKDNPNTFYITETSLEQPHPSYSSRLLGKYPNIGAIVTMTKGGRSKNGFSEESGGLRRNGKKSVRESVDSIRNAIAEGGFTSVSIPDNLGPDADLSDADTEYIYNTLGKMLKGAGFAI